VRISVIIPAYNEERLLPATLQQVKSAMPAFTDRGWEAELIVCDNNSTDRTAELARAAGATVVFEPENQIGRARNRGASVASGDWLMFVDADSLPSRELFAEVSDQIATGNCVAGGCLVKLDRAHRTGARVVALWNFLSRTLKLLAGSFIFCETSAFRAVGGFNQALFAGEELDLSSKLKAVGCKQGKTVVILHRHPLITSARKVDLYTLREHLWFFVKAMFATKKVLSSREACYTWYDGRR
jgi:glycosyltransferase involved in cell wall biosynthesis